MIITKMALPRRTFLRGLGATFALPLLDAMVPAFSATAKRRRETGVPARLRLCPERSAMNDAFNYWTPKGTGADFEFSPILAPLSPYRDRLTIVSGLAQKQAESLGDGNGEHTRACATWLNGVHPKKTEGADIRLGTTADQIAAAQLGKETVLPSMELISSEIDLVLGGQCEAGYSCAYMNTVSWQSPTTPLPVENNPSVVFDRLFGEGGTPEERLERMKKKRSLLDRVNQDLARLQRSLGSARPRAGHRVLRRGARSRAAHPDGRRAEHQLDAAGARPSDRHPVAIRRSPEAAVRPAVARVSRRSDSRLHADVRTRAEQPQLPGDRHLRAASRAVASRRQAGADREVLALNTFHAELFALLPRRSCARRPMAMAICSTTRILLYGGAMSNPNVHLHVNLPLVVAGGGAGRLKGGRHLAFNPADNVPMTNLLVSMLDKGGVTVDKLGDSTGRIDLDTLAGL